MFVLSANGDMLSTDEGTDEKSVIRLDNADDTTWRCAACGESLSADVDGYTDESGLLTCPDYDPDEDPNHGGDTGSDDGEGPHRAVRAPLAWANGATIHTDPDEDSITVTISVGDPRGAFAFTVRRVPDTAETNGGRLLLHTPYPGEPAPHVGLTEHHAGTYRVG